MDNPFTPRAALTPDRLAAYLDGTLSPEQRHEVELLMEESSLHREAVEGAHLLPAGALGDLQRHRPNGGAGHSIRLVGVGTLLVAGAAAWWLVRPGAHEVERRDAPAPEATTTTAPFADTALEVNTAMITQAIELPESLLIGHDHPMPVPRAPTIADSTRREQPTVPIDVIQPRSTGAATVDSIRDPRPRNTRPSRKLLWVHGLKLVAPEELYAKELLLVVDPGGVPAAYADAGARTTTDDHAVPYTDHMTDALGHFDRGEHKAALEALQVVLRQRPDDLNALFYSGLCCYNLGLFNKATTLFQRAAHHRIESFDEEAYWFHALSVERAQGGAAAALLFERIAAQGGFYAERAKARID